MEQQIVRELLTITVGQTTEADKVVGARFNQVAMLALNQAERYLLFGPEQSRLAVTKSLLSAVSRLSAADTEEHLSIHRAAFMRELESIRNVTPHLLDADTEAITSRVNDQTDES